ncbi:collagen alpha-1(III) chain-like [Canis lupus familiaris]|uniref:collagen alpha-1(III) chain-like n=1 Tax=Canis lupus familiaris TaxID=9615 RepID=UPI0018F657A9|nr:collagen alpha-1(III) chain-like [Canis lupus familiaris]
MPAGAPPPLGRMAQAGRPAGAHILQPGRGARRPSGGERAKAAARRGRPRPARAGRAPALRPRGERRRRRGVGLRGGGEGGRAAPPRTVRVSRLRSEPRAEGAARPGGAGGGDAAGRGGPPRAARSGGSRGAAPPAGAARVVRGLRLSAPCRRPRRRGRQEAGAGGARGEGAVRRGAWGRAAAARRRGGARGSRGPAARAHRARRRAARPLGRLPPRVCLSARSPPPPQRVPTPPARPGSRHPPSPPLELEPEPPARRPLPLAAAPSPPWERLETGRGLGLDRRAPPDGVATVTGWPAKQFGVPTQLRVRPADPDGYCGEGAFPRGRC